MKNLVSSLLKNNLRPLMFILIVLLVLPLTLFLVQQSQRLWPRATSADYGPKIRVIVPKGDKYLNTEFLVSLVLRGSLDAADLVIGYDSTKMTIVTEPQSVSGLTLVKNVNNVNGINSLITLSFISANNSTSVNLGDGQIVTILHITPISLGPAVLLLMPQSSVADSGLNVTGVSIPSTGLLIGSFSFVNPPTPSPTSAASPTPTPTPTPPPPLETRRVNNGGPSYTDPQGRVWAADKPYSAGSFGYTTTGMSTYSTTQPIAGTDQDPLYQKELYAGKNWNYRFDLPNGNYQVTLKFAEIYGSACGVGKRLFHVKIQGTQVLTNFDIYASAGNACYKAVDRTFNATVSNGYLNLDFIYIANKNTPKVNAIEVISSGGGVTPTPTIRPTSTPTPTPAPTGGPTSTPMPTSAVTPTATPPPQPTPTPLPGGIATRVDSGGSQNLTDSQGNLWSADKQYTAGSFGYVESGTSTYSTTNIIKDINGTALPAANQKLYQTERWKGGNFSYKFDLPNGNYQVTLKFAEIYGSSCALGKRLFNVKIQGTQVLTNFDTFKEAQNRCYTQVDRTVNASVSNGQFLIEFILISGKGSPKINAIQVIKI